ncbi:ACT domain protein [Pelomyxa schiedti]|nr:ACT domain protein [Pelomyxa schiedti]
MDTEPERSAMRIIAENRRGVLRDIATVVADHEANIVMINQEVFDSGPFCGMAELYFEYDNDDPSDRDTLIEDMPFGDIFGKRVIIIGGGAQVAQVALGAVNEADRHNIRGERISIDTIPLVGERTLAHAVDAVARLPRASILVLAGSIMGGDISRAVDRVREAGIPVIALKMAGTVPEHADLVVTDPIQAGVFAVMQRAVSVLSHDGLIVYPTDTIYGLGADALSEEAIYKVYEVKKRPLGMPVSIAVSDFEMLDAVGRLEPWMYGNAYRRFSPEAPVS